MAEIWDYLALENVLVADRMIRRLDARFMSLLQFPEAGVARSDIAPTARMLVEYPYVIIYRLLPDAVQVIRILHGARDIGRLDLGAG